MDVDTAELNNLEALGMDPKELKRLQDEGRCFTCKRQGHMARNCPKKPRRDKGRDKGKERDRP
jgi:hypothetical protein